MKKRTEIFTGTPEKGLQIWLKNNNINIRKNGSVIKLEPAEAYLLLNFLKHQLNEN